MNKFLIIVSILCISNIAFAQNNSEKNNTKKDSSLYFELANRNFVKNNEFESEHVEGYTLLGYNLNAAVKYIINNKISIKTGIALIKYSGIPDYSTQEPIFSAYYNPNKNASIILGTLDNSNNHGLKDYLFHSENLYTYNPENGIQVKINYHNWKLDTWVNWENFIFDNDPEQEMFTFGLNSNLRISGNDKNALSFPFQAIFKHRGGEIDLNEDKIQTIINLYAGLNKKFPIAKNSLILSAGYLYYQDSSNQKEFIYDNGDGFDIAAKYSYLNSNIGLKYIYLHKFVAPQGNPLYQNVSYCDTTTCKAEREFLVVEYNYNKRLANGISFSANVGIDYDLTDNQINNQVMIALKINTDILIKSFKK
ncbi:MAG: hypothetical protein N4A49_00725 [Marinifilaceae bacterium]|jgi:hypothetical protein|nr:hypothetical protein [Marinifilaceae bacterium]